MSSSLVVKDLKAFFERSVGLIILHLINTGMYLSSAVLHRARVHGSAAVVSVVSVLSKDTLSNCALEFQTDLVNLP